MIHRHITNKVLQLAEKFPAIVMTGPRQSGKTTLVRYLFPDYKYITLEEPDIRWYALNDPRGFIKSAGDCFILDEVQRVPELFSYLQNYLDEKKKNGSVILSGSQSFLLNEKISQSLAGRVANFKLLPLSYSELFQAKLAENITNKQIVKGFYPRIYDREIDFTDFYPHYIETYLERDVRQLVNIGDLNQFMLFIRLCAGRCGQLLNLSSLAQDADISVNTAKRWISVLTASYIIFLLPPYYRNFNKRITKMPKLYFYDTGLLCSLLKINHHEQLNNFYNQSHIFENLVVAEILKNIYNYAMPYELYYWRESNGNEIDLVIEMPQHLVSIEIKMTETLNPQHFKGIHKFRHIAQSNIEGLVIYAGNDNFDYQQDKYLSWKNVGDYLLTKFKGNI